MIKKISACVALVFFLGITVVASVPESQTSQSRDGYLKSYRYRVPPKPCRQEFREVEILIKSFVKVYMDFYSMGNRHFILDNQEYMGYLLKNTGFIETFLMLADRMVRNMAYVPGLYEIDIKTGLAIDHGITGEK